MVERFREPEQDVLALFGFLEVELGALFDDGAAMLDKMLEHAFKGERLRHAVDKREHVVVKSALKLGVFVEIVEYRLRVRCALKLDDDADIFG